MRAFLLEGCFIPLEEFGYTLFNLDLVCPTERVELRHIDELAHGTIGLGSIELDSALETNNLHH